MTQPRARYLDGPIAIIGAGIGGLTAALSLQHFGVPVRVFEQARARLSPQSTDGDLKLEVTTLMYEINQALNCSSILTVQVTAD